MRKILVGLAALITLAFASCTKEKSFEDESPTGPGGGMTDGNLLAKIVIQMGSDSATTSFGYDAGNRLVTEANKGALSIVSDDSVQQVTRDLTSDGFPRRFIYNLRVEWTPSGDGPPDATLSRE